MDISITRAGSKAFVDCLKIVAASIFLSLASQIVFILPFTPIMVTFQTAALFLIGITLGPIHAGLAVLLYLFEGLIGLPVFAFGQSGLAVLLGPKGGYYFGFCFAAFISGFTEKKQGVLRLAMIFALGNGAIYLFGLVWLAFFVGIPSALTLGFFPFLLGDVLKIGAVVACVKGFSYYKPIN